MRDLMRMLISIHTFLLLHLIALHFRLSMILKLDGFNFIHM